jgi:ligand-binding sensor domain-containing protein/signal transduction histidine kinase/CheY-like chemotaxis protein/AraC-like DNA-binding protein
VKKSITQRTDLNVQFLITILIIVATPFLSNAQDTKFEQYGINEGLSQNTVSCILQDKKGFMWFGTRDGLNKYDGYKFIVYKRSLQNKNSLSANDIKAIAEDRLGNLWIATWAGGLNVFNPKDESFIHYRNNPKDFNSISSDYIRTLCFDAEGRLWIGTGDRGLDLYDQQKNKFFHFPYEKDNPGSLSDSTVTTIYEDEKRNLWIGTIKGGLNLYDRSKKSFTRLQHNPLDPESLPNNNIQFITRGSRGNLWIGTYGGGLSSLDRETLKFTSVSTFNEQKNQAKVLLSVAEDRDGNLWIGTENEGLRFLDQDKQSVNAFYHYDNDNTSISSNSVTALYKDSKGNIWIGTFQGGINLINSDIRKFKHYKHKQGANSISSNTITNLYEDSDQNLWISTDGGGLNLFDRRSGIFTPFKQDLKNTNTIASNYVLTSCEDSNKNLWIGTWGEGVSRYDMRSKRFRNYKHDQQTNSLSNNYAFYIFKDSKQRIWIGTYGGGLNLYNPVKDNFKYFVHNEKDPHSISTNYILTIFEDDQGRLWIGTDGGGLNYFDEQNSTFISFKYDETTRSITNNIVNSICQDELGFLWLGTNSGLDKFDPNSKTIVASYFSEQGLANDVVTGILRDAHNNLWIGTTKGLSKFSPATNTFKNFTLSDGIQSNEFRTQCMSKSGIMYFGGKNGFNEFSPDNINDISFDPPIVFTGFQIFNKDVPIVKEGDSSPLHTSIAETKEIVLSYKASVITFEFASLNYTGKEKKLYRYLLEGFDKSWNYIGSKNNVTYTNLDPGTYKLRVSGLTNDGKWSAQEATIKLTVIPPFWKTWAFKFLSLLSFISIIVLIFYFRLSSVKKRNKLLKQEVESRTSELLEANYSLIEINEKVKTQNEKLEEFNLEMVRQSDKILQQQEKIVLQNQTLEETVHQLENTNKTKDRFFSILAHDLKNPVAALTGITDILKIKIQKLNPDEVNTYVDNINQSSHAINKLLKNLLDWAKTHAQEIPYKPVSINIYELVMKNLSLVEQQLRQKYIEVKTEVGSHYCIYADYHMTDTIIRNILSNCVKFTPPYGHIQISARESDVEIEIAIRDTGVGMTEEKIQNLFQTDKKDISVGTSGETGTGLGLIIVKEFLEVNKGSIYVSSILEEGSTFCIKLPKTSAQSSLSDPAAYEHQHTEGIAKISSIDKLSDDKISKIKGKRILIVDDNKEIRAFLRLLLSSTCEIGEAENGIKGLEAAIQFQPSIIISDMIMPEMNGLEFCEKIKGDTLTSHIPVILLTSQTEDAHQLSGYEAGADVYLTKPIKAPILFQVIHNIIVAQERIHEKYAQSNDIYPVNLSLNKLDDEFLTKVIGFIEEHLSESDLDYKKICELTAMSRSLLYMKIKTITGHGVHDLIKSVRLKKGLALLLAGRLNITQIAFEVGFTTPSHFSKSFIKQYGSSPTEYLSNLKKKAKDSFGQ